MSGSGEGGGGGDSGHWPIRVTDPKQNVIEINDHTVSHAAKHFDDDVDEAERLMVMVCSDPDYVVSNPSNVRNVRTADERYVRASEGRHVIVPVKTVSAGTKVATTCYATSSGPSGRRLWFRTS